MARVALTLRYQGRAFWRRMLRRGQTRFYAIVLALGGWYMALKLPLVLSGASKDLSAGQTTSMQQVLIGLCIAWLLILTEGRGGTATSERLRRFPLDVSSMVAIRVLSLWLSPIAWMVTVASLLSLFPFRSARHPLSGSLAALCLYAVTVGLGMTVSMLRPIRSTGTAATLCITAAVAALAIGRYEWTPYLRAGLAMMNPAALATTAAMATASIDRVMSLGFLALSGAVVWRLLLWAFPRSLDAEAARPSPRRSRRVASLPGRLGPLILKEHRSVLRIPDLWMGLLPVVVASVYSFTALGSSTLRLLALALTGALNLNLTSNSLGLDRPAALTRYLILPIRGRELLLAKNIGLAGALAIQVAPLLAISAWRGGDGELGAALLVWAVSLLGHLAWGNIVSVFEPRRAEPYGFAHGMDPVTALVYLALGAAPGLGLIVLLLFASSHMPLGIAAIVLGTMAWYYGSLRYAGASFERRAEIISRRLA